MCQEQMHNCTLLHLGGTILHWLWAKCTASILRLERSYSSVNGPPAEQQAAISINLDVTRSRLTMRLTMLDRLTMRLTCGDLHCEGIPAVCGSNNLCWYGSNIG